MSESHYTKDINSSKEISLREFILKTRELFFYIIKKWVSIFLVVLIGAVIGFLYAYTQKPSYTATTTFVLEGGESNGGLSQYSGLASIIGINLGNEGGGIFQGDNILELYKSRKMLEKTLTMPVIVNGKSSSLIESYIGFNQLRKDWQNEPLLLKLNFENITNISYAESDSSQIRRLRDSVLGKVIENINKSYLTVSKPDKKLSVIRVEVKSPNEWFSKEFNEGLVKNVNEFYIKTKTKKSIDNVTILQGKVDSVRMVMNGAIYSAVAAIDATPNVNPTKLIQRDVPTQKARVSIEANKAILANLIQSLELGKISLLNETPLIQTIDVPIYPLKKAKFGKIKGVFIGGFLTAFVFVVILIIKLSLRRILSE